MIHYYLAIIYLILLGIYGLGLVFTGLRAIQRRRPVYNIHQGWSIGNYLFFLVLWTMLLASFGTQYFEIDNEHLSVTNVIIIILISALLAFLVGVLPRLRKSKSTANAMIFGINKKVLDLIRQALGKEGIAFDETHEDFTLLDLNARIYTTIWSGIGYATLKIDPKEQLPVLEKIIQFMKDYDKGHSDHFSIKFMILQVVCGLVLAGTGIIFAYLFLQIVIV